MSTHESTASEIPTAVIVHLSGRYRGTTHRLFGERLRIGTRPDDEITFSKFDLTPGLSKLPETGPYATLERRGNSYELRAEPDADIWVNGVRIEHIVLAAGDVIEIGQGGPVLRFRLYRPGARPYKSVSEVFSDALGSARHGRSAIDRAGILLAGPPVGLLTQTSPIVRLTVALFLGVLIGGIGWLWFRNIVLEQRLEAETAYVRGLADLLERNEGGMSDEEFGELRDEMEARLSQSVARIEALEARAGARKRVISSAARSVVFLQGAYGFDAIDGRPLRFVGIGPDGNPVRTPFGEPEVTLEGNGPPVEIFYTGTAFVVTPDGHLLSNRHVALPWEYDAPVTVFVARGFVPVMRRFIGYLPGDVESFEVELIRASEVRDVALLKYEPMGDEVPPLELATTPARVGDEVIVLGYPTGMHALLARTDPDVARELLGEGPPDFFDLASRLAAGGHIAPLATVGVIGQVTPGSVVYDAETTHGGSGGPVLNLDGKVLAVNAAVLPQFDGSNMGVPADEALRLLQAGDESETPVEEPVPADGGDEVGD